MKKVLVIVPTRNRPENSLDFHKHFAQMSEISDLCFGLDDDDVEYPRIPGVIYEVNPRMWMNGTLNYIAKKYANDYEYIAFLGDDHRPRTPGWDKMLVASIDQIENGIAYGRDLTQEGVEFPICTAVLLDARIVRKLGYMAPLKLKHLYLDNFWRDLGLATGKLRYRTDVIVEHMHPVVNKAEWDEGYREVNDKSVYEYDQNIYKQYHLSGDFERAVELLK